MNPYWTPSPPNDHGVRLQRLRQMNRVSLADMSRKTGLGIDYLASVESGRIEISSATHRQISKAIDDLVREKTDSLR